MTGRALLPLWVAVATLLACARPAPADTGDLAFTVTPAYATVDTQGVRPEGLGLAADVEYGLTEALWGRVTAAGSMHPYPGARDAATFGGAEIGVTYSLDILRVIPFVDVGLAGVYYAGGPSGQAQGKGMNVGAEFGVGFDVLESRTFSWGAVARYELFATAFTAIPAYFYLGPRLTWRLPD